MTATRRHAIVWLSSLTTQPTPIVWPVPPRLTGDLGIESREVCYMAPVSNRKSVLHHVISYGSVTLLSIV